MNPSATARMLSQLWFITVAVLAVAVLYLAKVLLLPLGFAILFAFLLAPLVALLERIRFPRPIAALLVILAFAGLLCVATWTIFTQLVAIANDLPTYGGNIAHILAGENFVGTAAVPPATIIRNPTPDAISTCPPGSNVNFGFV